MNRKIINRQMTGQRRVRHLACGLVALPFLLLSGSALADPFTDALKAAYEENPRLKAQRRTLEQSNERVSQAIANFRPDVNASYQTGRQRTRFDSDQWSYNDAETKELSVSQPIFQGGQNYFRYSSSKNQMLAGRADLHNQEQRVLLDAVTAYMDVVQNEQVLRLSQSNRDVLGKQLDASRSRFEVGDVTRTDVAQSESRLARSQSDMVQAQGQLDSAVASFERVMGYKPAALPLPMPANLPPLPKTLEEAIERAEKNSPNIESAEYLKESADDDVGFNVGSILPKVALVGNMRRQDGAGTNGASQFDTDSLQLNVTVPIYQQGAEYSRIREAKIIERRRKHELLDAEDETREQVIRAWEALEANISSIQAQEEVIRAAEVALDGVRQEQQYGARTILDVLDAEQELFLSRVNLVRAQRNRVVSIFTLLQAMGDLTVARLDVPAKTYDPVDHYDSVKWQLIGF